MGWGWLRKSERRLERWASGSRLQEQPGIAVAPFRKLKTRDADADWEFRFWGRYASYKAYDPHLDELLPVFVLQGYRGHRARQAPLRLRVGPPDRPHSRGSGASSRSSSPILSNRGID